MKGIGAVRKEVGYRVAFASKNLFFFTVKVDIMPKTAANAKIQTQPKQSFDSPESLLEFLNQPSFFLFV